MFTCAVSYGAVTAIPRFNNGFALQDGNALNKIVDAVNVINSAQAVFGGQATLDGTNPTPVTTGLTSILGCTVSLVNTVSPAATTILSYSKSAGTLNIYGWTF